MDAPFILLSSRLVLVPTPLAIKIPAYLDLYAFLHSQQKFCEMGFGSGFPARNWDEEQTRESINRGVAKSWKVTGLGDMAMGIWKGDAIGRVIPGSEGVRVVEDKDWEDFTADGKLWDKIEWVGYAGLRHAILSMPDRVPEDPSLPPWQELVELRYGVKPTSWGLGLAPEAARCIMAWAASERGVTRFVAETEKLNSRSGAVLIKLGFVATSTEYWKDPSEQEWEKRVVSTLA